MKKTRRPRHDDRAYQQEIEDAVWKFLWEKTGNPLVAAPGGTGKSFVMAKLIKRFVVEYPGTRVIVLAQDAKLLNQNCNELLRYWPDAPCGVFSAGLKQRDYIHPIIFAGIQSAAKHGELFGVRNIVLIDEADQVSHKEETLYQKLIVKLQEAEPELRVIGFTATPYRLGMGCLTNLDLWDEVVIDLTKTERFNYFIEHGFLSPLITKKTTKEIDVTNVSMRGGEFDEKELQEAADKDDLNRAVVDECIRYGADRKHWLVYSSGVEHGNRLTKIFNSRGISAVMLTGKDTMAWREEVEAKFRSGEIRALINCGLFLRGWDFPELDLIAWVRATQSTALWVQGTVRGTRRAPAKENCMVLDFAGNIRRLGPINDPIVPTPRRKGDAVKGEAPVKECPQCFSYLHTRTRICPDCGYEFPPPQTIKKQASSADIMRGQPSAIPQVEDFHVLGIRYSLHDSKQGNRNLLITYSVGTYNFREYLAFGSELIYAKRKCRVWWEHRGGILPIPRTCEEALDRAKDELNIPSVIRVIINQKYPEVVGCDFDPDAKIREEITVRVDKPLDYDDGMESVPF